MVVSQAKHGLHGLVLLVVLVVLVLLVLFVSLFVSLFVLVFVYAFALANAPGHAAHSSDPLTRPSLLHPETIKASAMSSCVGGGISICYSIADTLPMLRVMLAIPTRLPRFYSQKP